MGNYYNDLKYDFQDKLKALINGAIYTYNTDDGWDNMTTTMPEPKYTIRVTNIELNDHTVDKNFNLINEEDKVERIYRVYIGNSEMHRAPSREALPTAFIVDGTSSGPLAVFVKIVDVNGVPVPEDMKIDLCPDQAFLIREGLTSDDFIVEVV